jgi:hypothetical protein
MGKNPHVDTNTMENLNSQRISQGQAPKVQENISTDDLKLPTKQDSLASTQSPPHSKPSSASVDHEVPPESSVDGKKGCSECESVSQPIPEDLIENLKKKDLKTVATQLVKMSFSDASSAIDALLQKEIITYVDLRAIFSHMGYVEAADVLAQGAFSNDALVKILTAVAKGDPWLAARALDDDHISIERAVSILSAMNDETMGFIARNGSLSTTKKVKIFASDAMPVEKVVTFLSNYGKKTPHYNSLQGGKLAEIFNHEAMPIERAKAIFQLLPEDISKKILAFPISRMLSKEKREALNRLLPTTVKTEGQIDKQITKNENPPPPRSEIAKTVAKKNPLPVQPGVVKIVVEKNSSTVKLPSAVEVGGGEKIGTMQQQGREIARKKENLPTASPAATTRYKWLRIISVVVLSAVAVAALVAIAMYAIPAIGIAIPSGLFAAACIALAVDLFAGIAVHRFTSPMEKSPASITQK